MLLEQVEFQIDETGTEVIDTLISNLLAPRSVTRSAAVASLVSLVKLCKNQDLRFTIFHKVNFDHL